MRVCVCETMCAYVPPEAASSQPTLRRLFSGHRGLLSGLAPKTLPPSLPFVEQPQGDRECY